jgi:hypothetical protein
MVRQSYPELPKPRSQGTEGKGSEKAVDILQLGNEQLVCALRLGS